MVPPSYNPYWWLSLLTHAIPYKYRLILTGAHTIYFDMSFDALTGRRSWWTWAMRLTGAGWGGGPWLNPQTHFDGHKPNHFPLVGLHFGWRLFQCHAWLTGTHTRLHWMPFDRRKILVNSFTTPHSWKRCTGGKWFKSMEWYSTTFSELQVWVRQTCWWHAARVM